MAVAEQLKTTTAFSDQVDAILDGAKVMDDDRIRIGVGSFDQVIEHHRAIEKLVELELYGSAFSLVRALFEGFIRGVWLTQCSSDEELEAFHQKDEIPKRLDLIAAIEKKHLAFCGGFLTTAIGEKAWKAMCGYAHGGSHQVIRRITEYAVRPNYSDEEICELLRIADLFMLLGAFECINLTDREPRAVDILGMLHRCIDGMPHAMARPNPE